MSNIPITIGLTCSYREETLTDEQAQKLRHYCLALQDAGAAAKVLFLPPESTSFDDLAQLANSASADLQGLLITGGDDLPPQMYGAQPHPALGDVADPLRFTFEKKLIKAMIAQDKSILGICYGVQLLNVLEGGTLIQDIPSQIEGALEHRKGARHIVHTEPNTRLRQWLGESFEVASYHHQSVEKVAPNAVLAAQSPDGVVSAVEFPKYRFCVGVQWHPERTRESDATQILMKQFVDACQ